MSKTREILYYNLSSMLDAGVPVARAFASTGTTLSGSLPKKISQVGLNITKGKNISESMIENPGHFSMLDIAIIEAAEYSGNLGEAFKLLADWYSLTRKLRKKILSGLALPFFILHLAAFIGPFPFVVLKKITIADYISTVLAILAIFYVPFFIILAVMKLTPRKGLFRRFVDKLAISIPVLGSGIYYASLSRYCNAFYMLYKAGVPVTACAQKAAAVTGNLSVSKLVAGAELAVRNGQTFSEGFSKKLPKTFLEIWRTGEETASLDVVAKRLADNTAESSETYLTEFANWMPRLVYVFVSLMIILMIFNLAFMMKSMMNSLFQGF